MEEARYRELEQKREASGLSASEADELGGLLRAGRAAGGLPDPPPPTRPTKKPLNGFAVASLATGVLGIFVLAIPFGLLARRQIKRSNYAQRGWEIAGTGIGLGILWVVLIVITLWLFASI